MKFAKCSTKLCLIFTLIARKLTALAVSFVAKKRMGVHVSTRTPRIDTCAIKSAESFRHGEVGAWSDYLDVAAREAAACMARKKSVMPKNGLNGTAGLGEESGILVHGTARTCTVECRLELENICVLATVHDLSRIFFSSLPVALRICTFLAQPTV